MATRSTAAAPLSRARILECALDVADRDGLEAASLRRIATELGVHVTSLYNHLPTKDALLDGMVEELIVEAHVPVGDVGWEEWVRAFVGGMARIAVERPGSFAVLLHRPVQSPRATETFECALAAFRAEGLDAVQAYSAVKSVVFAVLGCCQELAGPARGERVETDVTGLDWQRFPQMHEVSRVAGDVDLAAMLTEVLVAGLAQQLPSRAKPRRTGSGGRR
ncbi:MAG TPA: TetR family transcriptional regulator [Mycobacteriales bacterium]|nr:TetR family transcriptional regulator [Mycobacteriales bacterium]